MKRSKTNLYTSNRFNYTKNGLWYTFGLKIREVQYSGNSTMNVNGNYQFVNLVCLSNSCTVDGTTLRLDGGGQALHNGNLFLTDIS